MHQPSKADHTHVQAVCQSQAGVTDAVELLSSQYFFTSPKLANLATEAEILAQVLLVAVWASQKDWSCIWHACWGVGNSCEAAHASVHVMHLLITVCKDSQHWRVQRAMH